MDHGLASRARDYHTSAGPAEARAPRLQPARVRDVDPVWVRLYIAFQTHSCARLASRRNSMATTLKDKLDLATLETRVDELIRQIDTLQHENEVLRSQQAALTAERATLVEKTEQARSRVEAMIARLKAMETR
jgi:cell division protein ZapB